MTTHLINEYWQLDSDSPSGLSWIKHKANTTAQAGQSACTTLDAKGYYVGSLGGKGYKAHRVVYYLKHGDWPDQVDHINGIRTCNYPSNLRGANNTENQHNRLVNGCYLEKATGKWKAYIRIDGRFKTLGRFLTRAEARKVYLEAKRQYHPTAPERCYATELQ